MKLNYYFPTVVGRFYDLELRNKMLPIVKDVLNNEELLTWKCGYRNTYSGSTGLQELPEFKEFANYLKKASNDYLLELGCASKVDLCPNIFASGMVEGDRHGKHDHPGSELSGIFYLDVPEGSADLVFHDSKTFRNNRSNMVQLQRSQSSIRIKPENGLFLIWESWIQHEVPVNNSSSPRTTLVFNMGL